MTRHDRAVGTPPERMRNYRVEAEPRDTPDLHQLAQLFIGMALRRVEEEQRTPEAPMAASGSGDDVEVESHT